MGTIIALGGGGDLLDYVRGSGEFREVHKVVYIGFASCNPEFGYNDMKNDLFGRFGIDVLHLTPQNALNSRELSERFLWDADLIYVDGGNTIQLMKTIRESGLDRVFAEIYEKSDIILSGASAGAICWCRYGNSDSLSFKGNEGKRARVSGLGIIDVLFCPHVLYDTYRPQDLKRMMANTPVIPAVAVDGAALVIHDGRFKAVPLCDFHLAYKSYWKHGNYYMENILSDEYRPLEMLTRKIPLSEC